MVWLYALELPGMMIDAHSLVDIVDIPAVDDNVCMESDDKSSISQAMCSGGMVGEVVVAGGVVCSDQGECCFDAADDKMSDNLDNS